MKIFWTIIYFIVIGQGCFFIGLALPRNSFNENKFPYKSFKWENSGKFYDRFYVKKWKSKVPDMSIITNKLFPKKVSTNYTADDFDRLVKESCVAEMIHYVLCVLSVGFYNIWKGWTGVVLSFLYFLGNIPFVMIQRYNRPNFESLRDRLRVREERKSNAAG